MAQYEVIMPKMGESIEEATITKWFVKVGDTVVEDDVLLEIATDKVDSEIPCPVEGVVSKLLYQQDEVVPVGSVIAIINLDGKDSEKHEPESSSAAPAPSTSVTSSKNADDTEKLVSSPKENLSNTPGRFYSPLVRKIAEEENIGQNVLDTIPGSGRDGRVQKQDILSFLEKNKTHKTAEKPISPSSDNVTSTQVTASTVVEKPVIPVSISAGDEIVQMDRMRKIIAEHMIKSIQVSAHVTNMLETDVTEIVNWRNKVKDEFEKRENEKITFLPIFLEAIIKALKDFPMINSSVDGDKIIIKKRINLGIAVALPGFNLIVPVIKNADNLNLVGMTKELNRLANAARNNKLKPEEIQDGTFTITNFGSFKNTIGTPIINQPQVAIIAIGNIEKKPAVLETPQGDVIAIRHKMFLSLTYDHRIIDGSLGGMFLRKVGDYIESFDSGRTV
jgi:2-oxoglutarate dehydrogenase E2 component (dihydrolipoamide succinyltransferase)